MERFGGRIPTTAKRIDNGRHDPDVAELAASLRQVRAGNRGATDMSDPVDPRGALSTATSARSPAAH
jgi:hypothetical protein